jgi:hypothetical protein
VQHGGRLYRINCDTRQIREGYCRRLTLSGVAL